MVPCPEIGYGGTATEEITNGIDTCGTDDRSEAEPRPDFGHGIDAEAVPVFCPKECPENAESRVCIPDTNLVKEPLSKPLKEEEDVQARDSDFDRFFAEILTALGLSIASLSGWGRVGLHDCTSSAGAKSWGYAGTRSSPSPRHPEVNIPNRLMVPKPSTAPCSALSNAKRKAGPRSIAKRSLWQ